MCGLEVQCLAIKFPAWESAPVRAGLFPADKILAEAPVREDGSRKSSATSSHPVFIGQLRALSQTGRGGLASAMDGKNPDGSSELANARAGAAIEGTCCTEG